MNVTAIAILFTNAGLHSEHIVEHAWIVHEPEELVETVWRHIEEHNRAVYGG